MAWYKNRTMYLSAFFGGILGVIFLITGLWLEMQRQNLPFSYWSYLYLHKTHYLFYLLDVAPLGFGILFGLVGLQRSLYSMISQNKKEQPSMPSLIRSLSPIKTASLFDVTMQYWTDLTQSL